jgi:hypothetical protein
MSQPPNPTNTSEALRVLKCLCGGSMVLTLVEPESEEYDRHRFECMTCHSTTLVTFTRIAPTRIAPV